LITHGHADHVRPGNQAYLCTHSAKPVVKYRLGSHTNIQSVAYGETTFINGVTFSFHPAGHIIGSAQIKVAYQGEIWVASGDYKTENDGINEAFESVKCHTFITESTFGRPIYNWQSQAIIAKEINDWWAKNRAEGKTSVLGVYALGKAQRVLRLLDSSIGKIYTHGTVENINKVIRSQGINLPDTIRIRQQIKRKAFEGSIVICPPGSLQTNWMAKFPAVVTALCSGWMQEENMGKENRVNNRFVLSDHADWEGLNTAVKATGAAKIITTHGYTESFAKWLTEQGLDASASPFKYV